MLDGAAGMLRGAGCRVCAANLFLHAPAVSDLKPMSQAACDDFKKRCIDTVRVYQPSFAVNIALDITAVTEIIEYPMRPKKQASYLGYFVDEPSMLIFALLFIDGETREKILGIREELYDSKSKAKYWRARLIKKIHPDNCKHQSANEATAKLNSLYERMIRHAE